MPSLQYYDLLQLLHECRDIVTEAQSRGLPTLVEGAEAARKINKLLASGILNPHSAGSLMLSDEFCAVLKEVAQGRDFPELSQAELERVALRLSVPTLTNEMTDDRYNDEN